MKKQFLFSASEPIVQTRSGKIRGFQLDGIYNFLGIKYADADRFQMPKPVKAWDGVKDAESFGYNCPILDNPLPSREIMIPHRFWPENEHCQYLNIWTKSINKNEKKPVMFWIHGGTFSSGSAIEHLAYDGDNMARYGDVVFITLNHRLNILGYLDMSSYGKKYENSVNAGIADLVEALKWVRDNIEAFGGDPGNVTIFGQSGGGRKTTTLMQTPSAAGLFHKAILQSGTANWNPVASANHEKLIKVLLAELEISESNFEKLETVPYPALARACARARYKLSTEGIMTAGAGDWTPVKNDWFLGAPPFHAFSEYAKSIPVMVGSNLCEVGSHPPIAERNNLSDEQKKTHIKEIYGDNAEELIRLFKTGYPGKNELLLLDYDTVYRHNLLRYAENKVKESNKGVPLYVYMFALEFDIEGGKGAWHCAEIPFAFHNAEKVPVCHMDGVMQNLEEEMSGAWIAFAHNSNPNHPGLSVKWPEYNNEDRAVMVFDRESSVKLNHEKELVELHKASSGKQITSRSGNRSVPKPDENKWVF